MTIEALIIEDDKDLAEAISDYMELDGMAFDFAYNGASGLTLVLENSYDIVLLDISMPKMDGLTVCQQLRQKGISTPILMLTARDTLEDKLKGFSAGTDDYLVKPFAMAELKMRIQALVRRTHGTVQKLTVANLTVDIDKHEVTRADKSISLSPVCWKILVCLIQHSPNVVSKHEIEKNVWGDDLPSADSLKVHLHKLRQHIDKPFSSPLIHTVHGVGMVLKE